jgi:hypothetical protein
MQTMFNVRFLNGPRWHAWGGYPDFVVHLKSGINARFFVRFFVGRSIAQGGIKKQEKKRGEKKKMNPPLFNKQ